MEPGKTTFALLATACPAILLTAALVWGEGSSAAEESGLVTAPACIINEGQARACRVDLHHSRRSSLEIVLPHSLPPGSLAVKFSDGADRKVHHRPLVFHPNQEGLAPGHQKWVLLFADQLVPLDTEGELSLVHSAPDGTTLRAPLASGEDLVAINAMWAEAENGR